MRRLTRLRFRVHCGRPAIERFAWPAAIISVAFFSLLSVQAKPLIRTMATSSALNAITLAVTEEADAILVEGRQEYGDFVSLTEDVEGQIKALQLRVNECVGFKRQLIERLAKRISVLDSDLLSVPMGSLTGIPFFSECGPSVRVRIKSIGDVSAQYRSEFKSTGINQTRHLVWIDVQVTVYILIPGELFSITASEQICIAETVIVGRVPDTYLGLENGAN